MNKSSLELLTTPSYQGNKATTSSHQQIAREVQEVRQQILQGDVSQFGKQAYDEMDIPPIEKYMEQVVGLWGHMASSEDKCTEISFAEVNKATEDYFRHTRRPESVSLDSYFDPFDNSNFEPKTNFTETSFILESITI